MFQRSQTFSLKLKLGVVPVPLANVSMLFEWALWQRLHVHVSVERWATNISACTHTNVLFTLVYYVLSREESLFFFLIHTDGPQKGRSPEAAYIDWTVRNLSQNWNCGIT